MSVAPPPPAPPRHNVLVVEDDPSIRALLMSALHAAGYAVSTADTGQAAMFETGRSQPDLILLDVGLPDIDGFAVTRHLRAEGVYTPVLFLTARTDVEDRIIGLSSGGDDYVTKPFHVQEVLLRIRAILRRSDMPPGSRARRPPLQYADLVLDEQTHEVRRAGLPIQLSPTEFRLLACLLAQPERVVGKKEILFEVWHYDFAGEARIVDTYVRNLRRKIDRFEPQLIQTIRGVGYCLRAGRPGPGSPAP